MTASLDPSRSVRVGFSGLGPDSPRYGARMARALVNGGYSLVVAKDDPVGLAAIEGFEFEVVDTTTHLVRSCDVLVLRDVSPVDEYDDASDVLAESRMEVVLEHAVPGLTIVNSRARGRLAQFRSWAERAAQAGASMIDAMPSGPVESDTSAWLSLLVGGERAAFERCLPVLEAMSNSATYMGKPGMGLMGKLFTSAVFNANTMVVAGMIDMGEKLGFDLAGLLHVARAGSADSYALRSLAEGLMDEPPGRQVMMDMFRGRLAIISADAREMGLEPTMLESWAYLGVDLMPAAMDRIASISPPT